MKTFFRILARIILGIVLALLLAEGAARLYLDVLPAPKNPVYLADRDAGYRLRPEPVSGDTAGAFFHVNALGFRDREHSPAKPANTRRVLGIGDSFVLGEVKPEENFLRLTEGWLSQAPAGAPKGAPGPPATEMILLGLGGYSPENYLGVLRSTGLPLNPDFALLCFFVGNDVTGIPARRAVLHGELYTLGSYNPWLDLARKSRLYVFLERIFFYQMRASRIRAQGRAQADPGAQPAPVSATDSLGRAGVDSAAPAAEQGAPAPRLSRFYRMVEANHLSLYLRQPPFSLELLWQEAEKDLLEFDRSCREAHVPWGLAIIPDDIQVDPAIRAEVLRGRGETEEAYDFDNPQRRLRDFATRRSVPVCDFLPDFRAAQRPDSVLYIPNDIHWSARGNRVAARVLTEYLARQFALIDAAKKASKNPHRPPAGTAIEPGRAVTLSEGEAPLPPAHREKPKEENPKPPAPAGPKEER